MYVIGESHSLSSHSILIQKQDEVFLCEALWIAGCKQWHLGNNSSNKYKYKFETLLSTMPRNSDILLAIGEIDCRINEGILKYCRKYPENIIFQVMKKTIDSYLQYVKKITQIYQHTVVIQAVPSPKIEYQKINNSESQLLIELIREFNTYLRLATGAIGFDFLDVYSLTDNGQGISNERWHIDNYHLSPEANVEVWRRKLAH
jgi:hypothetical protein